MSVHKCENQTRNLHFSPLLKTDVFLEADKPMHSSVIYNTIDHKSPIINKKAIIAEKDIYKLV